MLEWVKQRGRKAASPTRVGAALVAFGKHPGWDDHMPDIGAVSEVMASLKQNIYINGIGEQINSGAWERLEPEKRREGFDHTFLWTRRSHVVLGQLWSSTDRKGRAKYPMAACIHLENLPLTAALDTPLVLLDQVRDGCRQTTSGNHVELACRAAQDQLNQWLATVGAASNRLALDSNKKREFLAAPALQPNSQGLLRILHELDNALGRTHLKNADATTATEWRSYNIRVPLCAASAAEGLVLWAEFLRCTLSPAVPLLLVARHQTDWVDVIIGTPTGDSLFCLQASLRALPMATAIPYDIPPELPARLHKLTDCFLAGTSSGVNAPQGELPGQAGNGSSDGTRRKPAFLGLSLGILALLCVAVGFWLRPKLAGPGDRPRQATVTGHAISPVTPTARPERTPEPAKLPAESQKQKDLDSLLASGLQARTDKQWERATNLCTQALALAQELRDAASEQAARRALDFCREMAAADKLIRDGRLDEARQHAADALKQDPDNAAAAEIVREVEGSDRYGAALAKAQAALDRRDFGAAIELADAALEIKPKDPSASKLKADARAAQASGVIKAAQAAFDRGDFTQALTQSAAGLKGNPDDPALVKIKEAASLQIATIKAQREEQDLRQREQQQYTNTLNAVRAAMNRRDYAEAIAQADAALRLRRSDAEAAKLKIQAQQEQTFEAATAAFSQGDYAKAASRCQQFKGTDRFDRLSQQIGQEQNQLSDLQKALAEGSYGTILAHPLPSKPSFDKIKAVATEENRALEEATKKFAAGDYSYLPVLADQAYTIKPPFVTVLEAGLKEDQNLKDLRALRQANDRESVRTRLAQLTPEMRTKQPFAELGRWAAENSKGPRQASSVEPAKGSTAPDSTPAVPANSSPVREASSAAPLTGSVARLENVLRGLEVRFGLKEPDPAVLDREGNPVARESSISKAKRAEASAKVRYLREYRSDGWLTEERKVRLQKLDEAIRNWKD